MGLHHRAKVRGDVQLWVKDCNHYWPPSAGVFQLANSCNKGTKSESITQITRQVRPGAYFLIYWPMLLDYHNFYYILHKSKIIILAHQSPFHCRRTDDLAHLDDRKRLFRGQSKYCLPVLINKCTLYGSNLPQVHRASYKTPGLFIIWKLRYLPLRLG